MLFGWKRKPISPSEELTLNRFLSLGVQIDTNSISFTTYRGYNGSVPTACLVVGFGLDLLDQSDKGFLIEMCGAAFVRGREIASIVSTHHEMASHMSKLSRQPLFDEIVKLQIRHDKLVDDVVGPEDPVPPTRDDMADILDGFNDGDMTWREMREAIILIAVHELDATLERFAAGEIGQPELLLALKQLARR